MSVTSSRNIQVQFSGDVAFDLIQSALDNAASPGEVDIVSLVSGANTITPPSVSGVVITALTIIPPAANTALITFKGVSGDTGVPLHKTDPTTVALDSTFTSLVLDAASSVVGVRLIWS